jgi:hypothetical protein
MFISRFNSRKKRDDRTGDQMNIMRDWDQGVRQQQGRVNHGIQMNTTGDFLQELIFQKREDPADTQRDLNQEVLQQERKVHTRNQRNSTRDRYEEFLQQKRDLESRSLISGRERDHTASDGTCPGDEVAQW